MQFPKLPGAAAPQAAGSFKAGSALPNVSAPSLLLPPGIRAPARTLTGLVPAKIRDLARYGILAQQKMATIRRANASARPASHPSMHPANKDFLQATTPQRVGSNTTDPIFNASAGTIKPGGLVTGSKNALVPGKSQIRAQEDGAMVPTGTPAFAVAEVIAGQGGGITRGSFVSSDSRDPSGIMTFEYNPEEISVDHGSGWIITDQPGRTHPFIQFGGGGQRKISFTLRLFYTHNEIGDVLQNVNWLHSFLMGQDGASDRLGTASSSKYISAPKTLSLKLGEMFDSVPCILLRAPVRYNTLFRPDTLLPLYAELNLELLEIGRGRAAKTVATRRTNAMAPHGNANGRQRVVGK